LSDSETGVGEEAQPATPSFGSTVTILFSDIRGFTEYTDENGDEAAYTMLRLHNTLVLIYQAHAAADAWSATSPPTADPLGSAGVSYSGGAINLNILKPGGNLGGELQAPALKDFALELVLSAKTGTDLEINWWLRGTSDSGLNLHIDLPTETMQLYWSPNVGDAQILAKDIRLSGLQSGTLIAIGVVANGTNISLYVNNARVAQVAETRANGGTTPGFYMDGQAGTLRLESVRYFAVS